MGWYIETIRNLGKAAQIVELYGAKFVSREQAKEAMDNPSIGVIVVMENGLFDAAGFAYDKKEFDAFAYPTKDDNRPRTFLVMDRKKAIELTGYSNEK